MRIMVAFPNTTVGIDYSRLVGELSISDNVQALGAHLKFTAVTHARDMLMHGEGPIPVGSKVGVYTDDGEFLFGGIIVTRTMDTPDKYTYDAYDFGFYLNKNMISIQFNNVDASTAIKEVLKNQRVKVGYICDIPTKIRKIYHANIVIDVIKDILEQAELDTGYKYRVEIRRANQVFIERYNDLEIEMTPVPVNKFDSTSPGVLGLDVQYVQTMEDLKTRVTVVSGTEKYLTHRAEARDELGEKMYGLLNEVIRADGKNDSQITNMAINRLLEVAPIGNIVSFKVFGDNRVRSGRIINISKSYIKGSLYGRYFVKSCIHTYTNNVYHVMELEVEYLPSEDEYYA